MKVPCKSSRAGGATPRTDALIGPAACGRCPKLDSLKQRAVCALWLLHLLTLWNLSKLRFLLSQLRPPTPAGPLDARLETNHLKKSKTGPKRNITEQRIQLLQESFPVTSRGSSSDTTCFQPRAAQRNTNWPRDTRNEEPNQHVELTRKRNQTSSLLKPTKTSNELSIPNSNWNW